MLAGHDAPQALKSEVDLKGVQLVFFHAAHTSARQYQHVTAIAVFLFAVYGLGCIRSHKCIYTFNYSVNISPVSMHFTMTMKSLISYFNFTYKKWCIDKDC